jgi:hypothetical protein
MKARFCRGKGISEAGIDLFRMVFYPAAVGIMNYLEITQLVRASFKQLFRINLMKKMDQPVAIPSQGLKDPGFGSGGRAGFFL